MSKIQASGVCSGEVAGTAFPPCLCRCCIIKVSEHFPEYSRNSLQVCALPLGQEAVLRAITGTIEMPKENDSFLVMFIQHLSCARLYCAPSFLAFCK